MQSSLSTGPASCVPVFFVNIKSKLKTHHLVTSMEIQHTLQLHKFGRSEWNFQEAIQTWERAEGARRGSFEAAKSISDKVFDSCGWSHEPFIVISM